MKTSQNCKSPMQRQRFIMTVKKMTERKAQKLVGRFQIFFLSHSAPGFQLWFYLHLCKWVVHWGLLLRLPWRTWVCPCEGQVWRWCSCFGCRDSGSTRYSGSWRLGQKEIQSSRRVWQLVLVNALQYSCLENPPPCQRSLAGHSLQGHKESDTTEATLSTQMQDIFCLWQLYPSES